MHIRSGRHFLAVRVARQPRPASEIQKILYEEQANTFVWDFAMLRSAYEVSLSRSRDP